MRKMMLSKNYDEKKVKFPCYVSPKLDGVPVIFWMEDGLLKMSSRQGKPILSIDHIYEQVATFVGREGIYLDNEVVLVGELTIPGWDFKDISGKVRKGLPCTDLILNVFHRDALLSVRSIWNGDYPHLDLIEQSGCHSQEELDLWIDSYPEEWEGIMIRNGDYMSAEGDAKPIRSWNSMKFKREPTVDLKVVGITEAIDKHGKKKGMLGSFQCAYKGRVINIGPGKMSHKERTKTWDNELLNYGRIIEVKYMKDDSYEDLRQPTFQQWRDDKQGEVSYD